MAIRLAGVVACAIALAVACSSSTTTESQNDTAGADAAAASPEGAVDPESDPGAGSGPGVDTDDPGVPTERGPAHGREVPSLVLPSQAPGSDGEWAALRADLERVLTPDQRATVPWPDLRNPDPIAVYRSCAEFQNWMARINNTPVLVEAYTAPASPERGWDLAMFGDRAALGLYSTIADPPYSMRVGGVVHPAATDITDALLAEVPEGSAAVVYWDSVGVSDLVDEHGNVLLTEPGWTDVGPWVAIMAPTEVGWRVWWDELTEIPPPGLGPDRGVPATPPDRSEL